MNNWFKRVWHAKYCWQYACWTTQSSKQFLYFLSNVMFVQSTSFSMLSLVVKLCVTNIWILCLYNEILLNLRIANYSSSYICIFILLYGFVPENVVLYWNAECVPNCNKRAINALICRWMIKWQVIIIDTFNNTLFTEEPIILEKWIKKRKWNYSFFVL